MPVLAAATGLAWEPLASALEESTHAGMLQETPSGYGFTHALIRQTVLEELSLPRRQRLHLAAAETIERVYAGNVAAHVGALASHCRLAGALVDPDQTLSYARQAADAASAVFAWEDAVGHLQTALEVLQHQGARDEHQRCDLLLALGEAQRRAGDRDAALATLNDAINSARNANAPEPFGRAVLSIAGSWIVDDPHWSPTRALLEEALRLLGPADSGLRARLMARLAVSVRFDSPDFPNRADRARALADAAVAMARRAGDVAGRAYASIVLNGTRFFPQHVDERLAIVREVIQLAEACGDYEVLADGRCKLYAILLERGDRDGFEIEFAAFARLVGALRQPVWRWELLLTQAMVALLDGRLEDAERLSEEAHAVGRAARGPGVTEHYQIQRFELRYHQGQLNELEPAYRAKVNATPISDQCERFAVILSELDRRHDAQDALDRCIADGLTRMTWEAPWSSGLTKAAQVCGYLDDRPRAAELYALLARYPDHNLVTGWSSRCEGPLSYYLGLLATTLRHWDDAERHFTAALTMTRRLRDRPHEAHTLRAHGEMLLRQGQNGDRARARALLVAAIARYDAMEMAHFAEKARALLATAGPAGASTAAYPDGLSEREVEVLRLVAAGKSNREVAELLVISVNTVFQHVRSILNKTGCANRTEAAAYALRHGLVE